MLDIICALIAVQIFYLGTKLASVDSCHVKFHSLSFIRLEATGGAGESENALMHRLRVPFYRLEGGTDVTTFFTFQAFSILCIGVIFILGLIFTFFVVNI